MVGFHYMTCQAVSTCTILTSLVQSPGVSLNNDEKIAIAIQLSKLGVDVLEAGFPIASIGDFEAVHRIAKEVGPLMEGREKIGKPMVREYLRV